LPAAYRRDDLLLLSGCLVIVGLLVVWGAL